MLQIVRADCPEGKDSVPEENQLGQYIPLHYHYVLLQDEHRVQAFQEAIKQIVRPGMRVLELGGGTGILSSFAARQGAQVTTVERNPVLVERSRQFIETNLLSEFIEVVEHDAMSYVPTEHVDVVICEMLHVAMLREKQLEIIDAFKRNYRRAFGDEVKLPILIPEASMLMVQPVQQSFDFSDYWAPTPTFQATQLESPRTFELAKLEVYASINYQDPYDLDFDCSLNLQAEATGEFNAVRFITQNILSVDEPNQSATTWPNQSLILPLYEPVAVEQGESLQIGFAYRSGGNLEDLDATLSGTAGAPKQAAVPELSKAA